MRAWPEREPDVCAWAQVSVHRDAHVSYEKRLYSVPYKLIGQKLWLRATSAMVELFDDQHQMIASHLRPTQPGGRATRNEHLPPAAQAWAMRTPQYCLEQAQSIGPACLALIRRLLGDRVLDRLRTVQGLLRVAQTYGPGRLEAACVLIGDIDFVSARTVRAMLDRGMDRQAPPAQVSAPNSPAYQGRGRFSNAGALNSNTVQ